jgi:hypothetical protein
MTDREPATGLWDLRSLVSGNPGPAPPPSPAQPPPPPAPASPADPPTWTVPEPGQPPEQRDGGRRRLAIVVGAAVAVLLVAGITAVAVRSRGGDPQAADQPVAAATTEVSTPAVTEPTAEPTTEPTPVETTDPEAEAVGELERISRRDLATITLNGQYAAQLASKNPGTQDKYQTTADGSHTFRATDILAEYEALRADDRNAGATIVLLKSTDYGKRQLYHGAPLWVTFALDDFAGRADVLDWCARRFADLSGEELANQCAVRRLEP